MQITRFTRSTRGVYAALATVLVMMIGAMVLILANGNRLVFEHAPLVDAAMEARLELTTAHLWFEEVISGDRNETIDQVWRHFDETDWYLRAMLEGGQNSEGTFAPLDDPELRETLHTTRQKLADFRAVAEQRWKARATSGAGTEIDQRFDAAFDELMVLVDDVQRRTQAKISAETKTFRALQIGVIGTSLGLALFVGVLFFRYEVRRRHAERQRQRLLEKLEAQNAELEQFSYAVSHDLRSPLITIKGYLGMLERDMAAADPVRIDEDMTRIGSAADKMQILLDDVLELSRIGRIVNPSQQVDLGKLVEEVLELLQGSLVEGNVEIHVDADLPVVPGDRVRLREVMQNLIENAVKYMGDQPNPRLEIGGRTCDNQMVCFVRDNGVGIDPRYHKRIFGLFDTLDRSGDGYGVGLALVKRIVEIHGGRIWVESDGPGRGCTFSFSIPENTEAANTPEARHERNADLHPAG